MLEITSDDIAALAEDDLRTLVGRLCEAELRFCGLPTSSVLWGGDQNASDGGVDVSVEISSGESPGGFVPRPHVGIQVKKNNLFPSLISPEMRPRGQLRESIQELIRQAGAYIIVSSGASTSSSALRNRLKEMRLAVADERNCADLHLDYYDRSRLATWTRQHPSLVLWVLQKIGRSAPGWKPFGSWSVSPEGEDSKYLIDNAARIYHGAPGTKSMNIVDGIESIRSVLRNPRGVVRLTGLSGVGKTRLVQALFDADIGTDPLTPSLAIYTDMGDGPSPLPPVMISNLIAARSPAVVVVDNCEPELHRRITDVCRASDCLISAITVEYDVQDDEPEGTNVFRLEPSSKELVSNLVSQRYPALSPTNLETIAEFAGGNARVALALAGSVDGDSLAGLRDEELLRRILFQRQPPDENLRRTAHACSLLYSFQGEALAGPTAELPLIGEVIGLDSRQVYAQVSRLEQRGLLQRRNVWRAVLPHAIANRLAMEALREIPTSLIEDRFSPIRLLKSFSRRLSYLHSSAEARRLVEKWLAPEGMLSDIGSLNADGLEVLQLVAPVSPERTLEAIERYIAASGAQGWDDESLRTLISDLLRKVAYDPSLFGRCVAAMIPLEIGAPPRSNRSQDSAIVSLFNLHYSGTHASIEQRAEVVCDLLNSTELARRLLGVRLLEALLNTYFSTSLHTFEFGGRSRDYGYAPQTRAEEIHWFKLVLQLARQHVIKEAPEAAGVRMIVADSIRNLWFLGDEIQAQFEDIATAISNGGYWNDGWIATRSTIRYMGDEAAADVAASAWLQDFEVKLRPKDIIERIWAVVLSSSHGVFDYADSENPDDAADRTVAHQHAMALAEELGHAISNDLTILVPLLPELVTGRKRRLYSFGRGLAKGASEHRRLWSQLTHTFEDTENSSRNPDVLCGYLSALCRINSDICDEILDEALSHPTLGPFFPSLQSSAQLTSLGAARLKQSAALGLAPPQSFLSVAWSPDLTASDISEIVLALAKDSQGTLVAIDILSHRFHEDRRIERSHAPELINSGRTLLTSFDLSIRNPSLDYELPILAEVCLCGTDGLDAATVLCERLLNAFTNYTAYSFHFEELVSTIFRLHPVTALDVFFGEQMLPNMAGTGPFQLGRLSLRRKSPLNGVPVETLINWCDQDASQRYPAVAHSASYIAPGGEGWSPVAHAMLMRAPDPLAVLKIFRSRFTPNSWSGSLADILSTRLILLDQIDNIGNPVLTAYASEVRPQLQREIASYRQSDEERDRDIYERFE